MMRKYLSPILLFLVVFGCELDRDAELPPVEERVEKATSDLVGLLTAPANGWRLEYQPDPTGAEFLIIMEYDANGSVRIQSDVTSGSGEFRDDTITYRIDARQGLELILETYGVFHFLSETVGGGFQFVFVNETDGSLVFRTKDTTIPTLVFQPAGPNDADQISTEAIPLLTRGVYQDVTLAGSVAIYNLYMPSDNNTISAVFDLENRRIQFEGVATGRTMSEIIASGSGTAIGERTNFTIANEVLMMSQPVSVTHNGARYTISEIPVENIVDLTESFCVGSSDSVVQFSSANVSGLGGLEMTSSLFMTHSSFVDSPDNPYSANFSAIFDENDESIGERIEELFPDAAAVQWYQGFEFGNGEVLNAFGVLSVNALNQANFYLHEFEYERQGNIMNLTFTDPFIVKRDGTEVTDEDRNNLATFTSEVFEGGQVYMIEVLTIDDLFEFYNACNGYKGFVFR